MTTYTITLSNTQDIALGFASVSQQDWIDSAVNARCNVAIEEIVGIVVQQCLANNVQIPGTKDDIVVLGFSKGWIKSGAERHEEALAQQTQG